MDDSMCTDRIAELERELAAVRAEAQTAFLDHATELERHREGGAQLMRALDASCQLIDALLAWLPEGLSLSPEVKIAKGQWTYAMRTINRAEGANERAGTS